MVKLIPIAEILASANSPNCSMPFLEIHIPENDKLPSKPDNFNVALAFNSKWNPVTTQPWSDTKGTDSLNSKSKNSFSNLKAPLTRMFCQVGCPAPQPYKIPALAGLPGVPTSTLAFPALATVALTSADPYTTKFCGVGLNTFLMSTPTPVTRMFPKSPNGTLIFGLAFN